MKTDQKKAIQIYKFLVRRHLQLLLKSNKTIAKYYTHTVGYIIFTCVQLQWAISQRYTRIM